MRKLLLWLLHSYFPLRYRANLDCHGNVSFGKNVILTTTSDALILIKSNSKIGNNVIIHADGNYVKIGKNCNLSDSCMLKLWGGSIEIGENTFVNSYTVLNGHGGLKIGNNVLIAMNVSIVPSNHIFSDISIPINSQNNLNKGIVICDDAWIGANSVILDGITIGRGAVIGAGSVVTRDVEPFTIVMGNPAKLKRKR